MDTIKATWKNGTIVLDSHANWPEGRRLVIREEPAFEIDFMTEDEQSDDPAAIEQWIEELRATSPMPFDSAENSKLLAWQEKMKAFNTEAAAKQMNEGLQ